MSAGGGINWDTLGLPAAEPNPDLNTRLVVATGPWVTGSGLDALYRCRGYAQPPQLDEPPFIPDAVRKAADFGRLAHGWVEGVENADATKELAAWSANFDVNSLYPQGGHHEVVVYFDCATRAAGMLPGRAARDYSGLPESCVAATLDYINLEQQWVDDLKTSAKAPPPTTRQLALGALVLASATLDPDVKVSITHKARRRPKSEATRTWHQHNRKSLLDFRDWIVREWEAYQEVASRGADTLDLTPSRDNCFFCRRDCPLRQT